MKPVGFALVFNYFVPFGVGRIKFIKERIFIGTSLLLVNGLIYQLFQFIIFTFIINYQIIFSLLMQCNKKTL